ncbi:hypothetical protein BDV35DRAFT_30345 [Aspergillus flavus]|uniref:Uncharacterized protein n=1 Tax=Aspergillus flavus TaxID=5059 RepID=A0A5N6GPE6_ASPFL|nr:hypothetical protein BDV35DRAFT_30345 [Aspergillus flavus]
MTISPEQVFLTGQVIAGVTVVFGLMVCYLGNVSRVGWRFRVTFFLSTANFGLGLEDMAFGRGL